MTYRKHKLTPALSNGTEARIATKQIPDGDYVVETTDGSRLDVVREERGYVYVDVTGHEVEDVVVRYDPEPVEEAYDLNQLKECIEAVETAVYATEKEDVDVKPITDALERVRMAIDAQEVPETIDYTETLERLLEATTERFDASEITALLNALVNKEVAPFEFPENLVNKGRVKVEVDRISVGGGGSDVTAIEQKLDTLINNPTVRDFFFEVADGNVSGYTKVNKFGRATNVDSGVDTDIHDGANADSYPTAALDDRDLWVAPTQARIHAIESTSANDTSAGSGARTIQVYGLTDWDTAETSEVITMNGTTPVNTTNSYVIIHRMKVLTSGGTNINTGTIYATAATDDTITAQINPQQGQTQMAVYGVPSTQTVFLNSYYASAIKGGQAISVAISLLLNPEPDSQTTAFQVKHTQGLATDGSSYVRHEAKPCMTFSGPCILKIQANASSNDTDVSAGFDLILKTE